MFNPDEHEMDSCSQREFDRWMRRAGSKPGFITRILMWFGR